MKKWGSFLEYAGLGKNEDDGEVFSGSYSGIDGGDIEAEYWFMGIEWADIDDIKDDYNYLYNAWRKIDAVPEFMDTTHCRLENEMGILYRMLPHRKEGKYIFERNSNSLKLNLLPLPFPNAAEHKKWGNNLTQATGFASYNDYETGVLKARQKLFAKLLKKGEKQKTIFCFGIGYKEEFLQVLDENRVLEEDKEPHILPHSQKAVFIYNNPSETAAIKRIVICCFPYTSDYQFDDTDWREICNLAIK